MGISVAAAQEVLVLLGRVRILHPQLAHLAQRLEHYLCNVGVVGSTPTVGLHA
jgi:hypothetical protein